MKLPKPFTVGTATGVSSRNAVLDETGNGRVAYLGSFLARSVLLTPLSVDFWILPSRGLFSPVLRFIFIDLDCLVLDDRVGTGLPP